MQTVYSRVITNSTRVEWDVDDYLSTGIKRNMSHSLWLEVIANGCIVPASRHIIVTYIRLDLIFCLCYYLLLFLLQYLRPICYSLLVVCTSILGPCEQCPRRVMNRSSLWWRKQYTPLKRRLTPTRLYRAVSQTAVILTQNAFKLTLLMQFYVFTIGHKRYHTFYSTLRWAGT
jgi:hypothetical protein